MIIKVKKEEEEQLRCFYLLSVLWCKRGGGEKNQTKAKEMLLFPLAMALKFSKLSKSTGE
jgi:hypothetical protein